jgi:DNA-binding LacI/PurR family transcriptional regulator
VKTEAPTKRTTLQDVARAAGIAKSTASMALNGNTTIAPATREAVLRAAAELGFEPNVHAKRLTGRARSVIGLFSGELEWSSGVRKLQRIQHLLTERGFDVPVYMGTSDSTVQNALLTNLRQQQPRALICDTGALVPAVRESLKQYRQNGGVIITYDREVQGLDCDCVVFDREDNTYQATRHLLELGHRRLGFYNNGGPVPSEPRWSGIVRAMAEFGAEIREDWMFSGMYEEGGAHLAHSFLALTDRPTALCIVNDYAATAFVATVQRAGVRVPQDVSVVTSANMPIAEHGGVPLTSMTYPYPLIAQNVVDLLVYRLENPDVGPSRRIVVGSELVRRESAVAYGGSGISDSHAPVVLGPHPPAPSPNSGRGGVW